MSNTQITEAVNHFLTVWDGALAGDFAPSLNCGEADAFAELCRTSNAPEIADHWIEAHSVGDEPRDPHYVPEPEPATS